MKRFLICTGMVLTIIGMVMPSGLTHAYTGRVKPEMRLPDHYPYIGFHGMGLLSVILENSVVIDDQEFVLSPDVVYHTLEVENASKAFIRPEVRVGYLLDSERKIVFLYLLE
jgi:hypothetical protein